MLQAGQTILNGKYRILKLIGEGGMARVWLAKELTFGGRQVAIKEPKADLLPEVQVEIARRYQREVRVCAELAQAQVPNVVRAITAEPYGDTLLLVMEYMPGGDLESLLRENREGLEIERAVAVAVNLLQALDEVHRHPLEIVHRDVKPSNVLFDEQGAVHLADFGLAQLAGVSGRSQFQGGPHPGTPMYMAPEQGRSPDPLTPAADLYALGCMLFEMLTGKRYKRVRPGTRASELRPEVPAWLDGVLACGLVQDPLSRFQTATEMAKALQIQRVERISISASVSVTPPLQTAASEGPLAASLPVLQRPFQPIELATNLVARTISELPAVCDADWQRAVDLFVRGHLTRWLRKIASGLERDFKLGDSMALRPLVEMGEELQKRAEIGEDSDPDARLEEFLELLGAAPPLLAVDPSALDFGSVEQEKDVIVEAKVVVRNVGRGYLFGEMQELVPWLTGGQFSCLAGEEKTVKVQARVRGQPAGEILEKEALKVSTNGGNVLLSARLRMLPARMELTPTRIKLSSVEQADLFIKIDARLTVRNVGAGVLIGQVSSDVDWLHVAPRSFQCASQYSEEIEIRVPRLADSEFGEKNAVIHIETNAGTQDVPVSLQVLPVSLSFSPECVDLGTVEQGEAVEVEGVLEVTNRGYGRLLGNAVTPSGWFVVTPKSFCCRRAEVVRFRVSTRYLSLLAPAQHHSVITLTTNGESTDIPVCLKVLPAKVAVEPAEVVLSQDYGAFSVSNVGKGVLKGRIEAEAEWLRVQPMEFECQAGQDGKRIGIWVAGLPRCWVAIETRTTIHLYSNAGDLSVPVRVHVDSLYKQEIVLNWRILWKNAWASEWDEVENGTQRILELGREVERLVAIAPAKYSFRRASRWTSRMLATLLRSGLDAPASVIRDPRRLGWTTGTLLCLPLIRLLFWILPCLREVQAILMAGEMGQKLGIDFGFIVALFWPCVLAIVFAVALWIFLGEASSEEVSSSVTWLVAALPFFLWAMVVWANLIDAIYQGMFGSISGTLAGLVGVNVLFVLSISSIDALYARADNTQQPVDTYSWHHRIDSESVVDGFLWGGWAGGSLGMLMGAGHSWIGVLGIAGVTSIWTLAIFRFFSVHRYAQGRIRPEIGACRGFTMTCANYLDHACTCGGEYLEMAKVE